MRYQACTTNIQIIQFDIFKLNVIAFERDAPVMGMNFVVFRDQRFDGKFLIRKCISIKLFESWSVDVFIVIDGS